MGDGAGRINGRWKMGNDHKEDLYKKNYFVNKIGALDPRFVVNNIFVESFFQKSLD